jgi:hypothetical protein
MTEYIANAFALGSVAPSLIISLWVVKLYGPVSWQTMKSLVTDGGHHIVNYDLLILGITLGFGVTAVECAFWLLAWLSKFFGVMGPTLSSYTASTRASVEYTTLFAVRQYAMICTGILYTIAGKRANNDFTYVGNVGWMVLFSMVMTTIGFLIILD